MSGNSSLSGIVHNDCNHYNILVRATATAHETNDYGHTAARHIYEISGIIDFDATVHTCLVYEVAVAMMYLMLCCDEPLAMTAYLLSGFESRAPLPPEERRLLRVLTAGRFVVSLVYGLLGAKRNPDNAYLLSTQEEGWKCLELLWSQSEQDLMDL